MALNASSGRSGGGLDAPSDLDGQAELAALRDEVQALRDSLAQERAERQRLQTILDRMPGAMAYWDSSLRLRFMNPYLARHWQHKGGGLLGRHITEVLSPGGWERTRPFVDAALAGQLQGDAQSDAAGGARDEGGFVLQHVILRFHYDLVSMCIQCAIQANASSSLAQPCVHYHEAATRFASGAAPRIKPPPI